MADNFPIRMPYEFFKIRPGGPRKQKREQGNRALKAASFFLLKNLKTKRPTVTPWGNSRNYSSSQRSTVKVSFAYNEYKDHFFQKEYARQWAAHADYLLRKGAQFEHKRGEGFDAIDDDIPIAKLVKSWQEEGDEHLFKIIVSPDKAADLDLKDHTRELMKVVEKDLGTKLQWAAVPHYNTLHFHVHIVCRSVRDDGTVLKLSKDYFTTGFRTRSQQLATEKLGLRTFQDILESRQKVLNARHITELDRLIDREINNELKKDHIYTLDWCTKNNKLYQKNLQIKQRLEYLESLDLAKPLTTASWYVDPTFLEDLKFMQEQDDIIKMQHRHYDQIINKDLRVVDNKLPNFGDTVIGRVVGTGINERNEDFRYILIEGIDGQIHHVKANGKIMRLRDNRQLAAGDIIHLERTKFVKDSKEISYIDVHAFSDWDALRMTTEITSIDRYIINHITNNGYIPESAPTANSVRVQFMKIIQGRVNYLQNLNVLNDRLEVNRYKLEEQARLKRGGIKLG